MRLQISARSHVGRVRRKNEDNLCFLGRTLPEQKLENYILNAVVPLKKPVLLGVFDGMGGYSCGELASAVTAQIAAERTGDIGVADAQTLLSGICHEANLAVCQKMREADGSLMGTTASMLFFQKRTYTLCNIGDSPVFQYRKGQLVPIHQEHTERATYEKITGKKADPNRKFRLTQNIGMFPDEIMIEPYCATGKPKAGDVYLICSDGITDMVSPAQITETIKHCVTAAEIAQSLENQALAAGGRDNATVICIRILRDLWGK